MKKYLLSLITLTLLLCEASFTGGGMAFAFDAGTYYTYTIISSVDKTVSVKWKSGTSPTTITIPSTVTYSSTTYKVIAVEDNAFKNCTTATTITIGSNVKTIGSSAFNGCSNVTSINFGSGTSYPCNVDTIKGSAFSSCSKLATINCYGGIEKWLAIGFNAGAAHPFTANSDDKTFKINNTAITEIEVPSTVTKIKKYAFYKNTALTSITIGTGVTSIGSYAFNGCSNLTTIKFGKSTDEPCNVDTIMDYVFGSCTKVNKVYCYGGIEKWLAIGFNPSTNGTPFGASTQTSKSFYLNGTSKTTVDISGTQVKPYAFYKSPVSTVNIGASVQTIGAYAFYGSKLTNLNFTNDSELTRIGANAFASCTSLKTPTLPTSLERIDGNAFNGCTSTYFKSITIPVNVTVCGDGVFTGCSNLNSVVWNAANCTTYDGTNPYKSSYGPFYNTTVKGQITSFTFGDAVEVIPMFCCYGMANLSSVTIPASVTSIGEKAFSGCTGLSIIIAKPVDPSDCGTNAFENVTKTIPVRLTSATSLSAYQEAEGWSEFEDISNILSGSCGTSATWTLNLTTGVLEISGTGAISNYTSGSPAPWHDYIAYISDIIINSEITTLGERCFESCDVETCTIPVSVTNFESQSFLSAKANKLYYGGTLSNWCAINMGAYNTLPQTQELYINSSKITSLVLPNIASLGTKAFMNMKGITSVTIPAFLTTIGADAFSGCSNLTDVYFHGTLAQWCAISFSNDQEANPAYNGAALHIDDSDIEGTVMVVKDAITSISNYAFCGVNNYTSIEINAETTIGANTFKNCTAQILYRGSASGTSGNVSWTWEDGVLTLTGTGTMNNYTATPSAPWSQYMASTTSIIVGEGITSLGEYAFYATAAPSVTLSLPSTLTSIGKSVGYGLKDLRILVIPDAVTTIGTSAFSSCTNLEKIYCPSTRPTLSKDYGAPKYTNFPTNKAFYVTASSYSSQYAGQWTDFTPQWHIEGDCGAEGDNVQYDLNITTGTLTISGTGAMADYNTTDNRAPWYDLRSDLTKLVIEEGVTTIGANAFYANYSFTEISFPASLEESKFASFATINGPTRVNYAGTLAQWCDVKLGALSSTPMNYGTPSFYANSTQITGTVTVPEGVDTIKNYTLINLGITNLYLPSTLEYIGSSAVDKNDATLTNVYYAGSAADWCGVGVASNTSHPLYEGKDNNPQLYCNGSKPTSLVVPAGVTTLNDYHFYNCQELTSVTISADITAIGANTFTNCSKLATIVWNATKCQNFSGTSYAPFYNVRSQITSITFGSSVKRIPGYLCYGMNNASLKSISIPNSVDTIGNYTFKGCSKLEEINFGEESSLTSLGNNAFENDSSLTNVVLPSKLREIKSSTFNSCNKLESVTIPDSVKQIATSSTTTIFNGCTALRTINWNADSCAGFNMSCNGQNNCNYFTPFKNVTSQITTFNIGANVRVLPRHLCYGMSGLASVTLPEGLKKIGDRVFYGCTELTSITIPSTVTSIGDDAFYNCTNITSVAADATTPPTIQSTTFPSTVESNAILTVPYNPTSRRAYSAHTYWSEFAHILPYILTFDLQGHGDAIDEKCVGAGRVDEELKPADPTAEHYNFGGWYQEAGCNTPFTFGGSGTVVSADKTIYAKWTIKNYQVTFDMQGHGSAIDPLTIDHGELVSEPSPAPTAVGYTFGGWFKEPGCSNEWNFSEDHVTDATTIYALWTINSYDVTFDLQGHGDPIAPQSINYNGLVSELSDPEADNYTFGGWFKEPGCSNEWDFAEDKVTDDLTLYAKWTLKGLALDENANNASLIAAYDGLTTNVTMARSLTNAQYNTFCLPFSLSASQMAATFGADYDLEELTDVTYDGEVLGLVFTKRDELVAGKPYLLQPENSVSNPSFENVTISNATPSDGLGNSYIEYHGVYSPTELQGGNKNLLFLGADNELFWPASTGNIKGFRAYFEVKGSARKAIKARIVRGKETATGIGIVESQKSKVESIKVIRNGQLFIIREGKMYNAQGALVK